MFFISTECVPEIGLTAEVPHYGVTENDYKDNGMESG